MPSDNSEQRWHHAFSDNCLGTLSQPAVVYSAAAAAQAAMDKDGSSSSDEQQYPMGRRRRWGIMFTTCPPVWACVHTYVGTCPWRGVLRPACSPHFEFHTVSNFGGSDETTEDHKAKVKDTVNGVLSNLVGWLHTEMVYTPEDGHPSKY